MRLINFALALAIFAFAVLITQRLMTSSETDWPAKSTMTADVSKRTTNLLDRAAALVGAEPARVTYGGFDMTSDIVKTRQSPAQVADQAQSAFESKLAAWKKQRRARSNVAARLLLDDLTTGFRLDGDNWSAVGVVRIPAGFEEPGFAVRGDVSTAEPTDDSLVVYADDTLRTGHATVSVLRLLSGDAMAADGTVPPALTPLEGQIELMAMRGSPGGKSPGILVRQSSDQPEIVAASRRRLLLNRKSVVSGDRHEQGRIVFSAHDDDWEAKVQIEARATGGVVEYIEYRKSHVGGGRT